MERRLFNSLLAGLGLAFGGRAVRARAGSMTAHIDSFLLRENDWVPNNARLPVILYRNALAVGGDDPASGFEELFVRNGWPPQWRNGVYPFHHYHTRGHEVLGFAAGSARLMLGGPGGRTVDVKAGDIVLLPAGTGHMNLGADAAFEVVGAYPPGQAFDIVRQAPDAGQRSRLLKLPFPATDPVLGLRGPVTKEWHIL